MEFYEKYKHKYSMITREREEVGDDGLTWWGDISDEELKRRVKESEK